MNEPHSLPPDGPTPPSSDDRLDEELVSYLEGDLESDEARRVEQRLATDEPVRRRLQQLAQSWDLLDQLPRAVANESFTRSTVEMVTIVAEQELAEQTANLPRVRRNRWLRAGGSIVAAGLVGFLLATVLRSDPNAKLLRDLPVIQNLELYRQVGEIDFLRKLNDENLFTEEPSESAKDDVTGASPAVSLLPAPASENERRAELARTTPAQKEDLHEEYDKLLTLGSDERDRLRRLDAALQADPHAERLRRIMVNYHQWLTGLSAVERVDLLSLDATDRVERIKGIRHEQVARLARQSGDSHLQPRDMQALHAWMQDLAKKHQDELLAEMTADQRKKYDAQDEAGRQRELLNFAWQQWRGRNPKASLANDAELKQLTDKLSPEAKKALESKSAPDQRQTAIQWVRDVARARTHMNGFGGRYNAAIRPQDRDQFFKQLPAEERERLRSLPPDEIRRELARLYFQSHKGPGPKDKPGGREGRPRFDPGGPKSNTDKPAESTSPAPQSP